MSSKSSIIGVFAILFLLVVVIVVFHEAEYDVSISKQAGNIVAIDSEGKIIASGVSNLDDVSVIQKAFDSITDNGIIHFDNSEYNLSRPVEVTNKSLVIQGSKAKFIINTGNSEPGYSFSGTRIKETRLLSNADKGDNLIVLDSTSDINPGDIITIYNDVSWCPDDYSDHKAGETYIVKSVFRDTVKLNSNLIRNYTTKLNSKARVYRPVTIKIDNCSFIGKGSEENVKGVMLKFCKNSKISNCYFDNNGQFSISFSTCYGIDVNKNVILNSNQDGYGYGVSISNACTDIKIRDNDIRYCRHCVASGCSDNYGVNRNIEILSNTLYAGKEAAVDAHPVTLDYLVTNNTIYAESNYAFSDGTIDSIFSNNIVYGNAVYKRGNITNSKKIISNNHIEKGSLFYQNDYENISEMVIINNSIKGRANDYGVYLKNTDVEKLNIDNNFITGVNYGILIYVRLKSSTITISNNTIEETRRDGIYLKYETISDDRFLNISHNTIQNTNKLNSDSNGISLYGIKNAIVCNNQISDDYNQTMYGIYEDNYCNYNSIYSNLIEGMVKGPVKIQGVNSIVKENYSAFPRSVD